MRTQSDVCGTWTMGRARSAATIFLMSTPGRYNVCRSSSCKPCSARKRCIVASTLHVRQGSGILFCCSATIFACVLSAACCRFGIAMPCVGPVSVWILDAQGLSKLCVRSCTLVRTVPSALLTYSLGAVCLRIKFQSESMQPKVPTQRLSPNNKKDCHYPVGRGKWNPRCTASSQNMVCMMTTCKPCIDQGST